MLISLEKNSVLHKACSAQISGQLCILFIAFCEKNNLFFQRFAPINSMCYIIWTEFLLEALMKTRKKGKLQHSSTENHLLKYSVQWEKLYWEENVNDDDEY